MGGQKTKTTTKPIYEKEITGAANTISGVYNQQAPKIEGYADAIGGLVPSLIEKYQQGDAGINAARDYNVGVLGGDYLGANPYLDDVLANSNNDTVNATQAAMGLRGLTGGSDYAGLIADRVSRNSLGTRYQDYDAERARMATAAGQSPGIAAGDVIGIAPAIGAAQTAAGLPMNAAMQYGAGMGGLLGQYTNSVQKTNPGAFGWAGLGLQGASLLSDVRAKEDIRQVGITDGGLPVYTYRYKGGSTVHMGVMAQDVEASQPDALGGEIGGFKTVNYGKVR